MRSEPSGQPTSLAAVRSAASERGLCPVKVELVRPLEKQPVASSAAHAQTMGVSEVVIEAA